MIPESDRKLIRMMIDAKANTLAEFIMDAVPTAVKAYITIDFINKTVDVDILEDRDE